MTASTSRIAKGVLVRTPSSLKEALVRETARRGASLNDVAVGILADAFDVAYVPTNRRSPLPGSSPVVLLRMPEELKAAIQAEAFRARLQHERRHPRRARGRARRPLRIEPSTVRALRGRPRKGHTHGRNQRLNERQGPLQGQGARRHHRRRQLRQLPPPGCRVLQGRRPRRLRPGSHARRPRRLSHLRHRVHGRLRRRQGQGRRRPRRRDLGAPERHDQVRGRAEDGHHGLARDDARRHRQVPLRGRREGAGRDGRHRQDPQGDGHRRRRQLPPRRLGGRGEVVRRADPRGRRRDGELHARLHRA